MTQEKRRSHPFRSGNLNFFQLACIPGASIGFQGILIGDHLARTYGVGTAICSIFLGNLVLWLFAVTIISMVGRAHFNAIDNIKEYIGKYGGIAVSIVLMFSLLNWYALQINSSVTALGNFFQPEALWQNNLTLRVGATLGLFSALLSIGGIRLLKWITVISLPLLLCYICYSFITCQCPVELKGSWEPSVSAVITSVLAILPGVINYPTFFRHSRSRAHSYLALSILLILITFFQISSIWMRFTITHDANLVFQLTTATTFVILLLTSCNLLNIYFAAACWEAIVPHFGGPKGYAIIGLLGTMTYTFVQISSPVLFFKDLTNCYLGNLGVVLVMAFLLRIIIKHRPRPLDKSINLVTWAFGCTIATLYEVQHFPQGTQASLTGSIASILFFLCAIFIEETKWAIKEKVIRGQARRYAAKKS